MKALGRSNVTFVRKKTFKKLTLRNTWSDIKVWSRMFAMNVQNVSMQQVNWNSYYRQFSCFLCNAQFKRKGDVKHHFCCTQYPRPSPVIMNIVFGQRQTTLADRSTVPAAENLLWFSLWCVSDDSVIVVNEQTLASDILLITTFSTVFIHTDDDFIIQSDVDVRIGENLIYFSLSVDKSIYWCFIQLGLRLLTSDQSF